MASTTVRVLCWILLLGTISAFAAGKHKVIIGYVSDINQKGFSLGEIRVVVPDEVQIRVPNEGRTELRRFAPDMLHIGMKVTVEGRLDSSVLTASSVELSWKEIGEKSVGGTALIERPSTLEPSSNGWSGTLQADGRKLHISPDTKLQVAMSEKEQQPLSSSQALTFGPDWFVTYEGVTKADGSVGVTSAMFTANTTSTEEQEYRKKQQPVIAEPDYENNKPGLAKIGSSSNIKILPEKQLADHVRAIGMSVVPQYQRDLPDSNPAKLQFRFFVIDRKNKVTVSYPDGTVLVPKSLLSELNNEAQLAGVLSTDIAGIVEEQGLRARSTRAKYSVIQWTTRGAQFVPVVGIGAAVAGGATGFAKSRYEHGLADQLMRVSLKYTLDAGYDIRQLPIAMEKMLGGRERRLRETLNNEIAAQYANTDFSKLKVGDDEYKQWRPTTK